eukprot:scaffold23341_cov18-Tisochrysis_lutea.AAC.2
MPCLYNQPFITHPSKSCASRRSHLWIIHTARALGSALFRVSALKQPCSYLACQAVLLLYPPLDHLRSDLICQIVFLFVLPLDHPSSNLACQVVLLVVPSFEEPRPEHSSGPHILQAACCIASVCMRALSVCWTASAEGVPRASPMAPVQGGQKNDQCAT